MRRPCLLPSQDCSIVCMTFFLIGLEKDKYMFAGRKHSSNGKLRCAYCACFRLMTAVFFGQINFPICKNISRNLDKYIFQFEQIQFAIWTNTIWTNTVCKNSDDGKLRCASIPILQHSLHDIHWIGEWRWRDCNRMWILHCSRTYLCYWLSQKMIQENLRTLALNSFVCQENEAWELTALSIILLNLLPYLQHWLPRGDGMFRGPG